MLIPVEEVAFARFNYPEYHKEGFEERVYTRNYMDWEIQIKPGVCGFRLYTKFIGVVPGKTYPWSNYPLEVSSHPVDYSPFYYCNAIVMSWDEAKRRYGGYNDDPRLANHDLWDGEFWTHDYRLDMDVYYFKGDGKIYIGEHDMTSAYPKGFVVDEYLNSSCVE
jgi:hypothetical protein